MTKALCYIALVVSATIWTVIGLGVYKTLSVYAKIIMMQEEGVLLTAEDFEK